MPSFRGAVFQPLCRESSVRCAGENDPISLHWSKRILMIQCEVTVLQKESKPILHPQFLAAALCASKPGVGKLSEW